MSDFLAALRERWTIARCVRTMRRSAHSPSKYDSSAALDRLVFMNSVRSITAIFGLDANPVTAPRLELYAPSFGESDVPAVAELLRARRLPPSVCSKLIHRIAYHHGHVPAAKAVLEELARSGQPERERVVQSLVESARTNYSSLPAREASIRLLVRTAHDMPEVRQLLAEVPAHNDCQRKPLEMLSRELVQDRSLPREIREAVFPKLCWLLSGAEFAEVVEALLADPDERLSLLVLEHTAHLAIPLSPASADRVASRLAHFDPPVRVAAAKTLARAGDRRGIDYILALQKPTLQTLQALGPLADGRCAQHAWRIYSQSRDRSALAFVEGCLARDPDGIPTEVLHGVLKLPRQVTQTTEHFVRGLSGEDLRNWYYEHENTPSAVPPTEDSRYTTTRVIEDNTHIVTLAEAQKKRRGGGSGRGRRR
jgi:hypothetical protein